MVAKLRSITKAGAEREPVAIDASVARRLEDALWGGVIDETALEAAAAAEGEEDEDDEALGAQDAHGTPLSHPLGPAALGALTAAPQSPSALASMYGETLSTPIPRRRQAVPARYKDLKKKRGGAVDLGGVGSRKLDGMVQADELNAIRTLANPVVQFKLDTSHVDLIEAIEASGEFPPLNLGNFDDDVLYMKSDPGYTTAGGVPVLLNSPRSIVVLLRTGVSVSQLQRTPPPCVDPDAPVAPAQHNPVYRHRELRRAQLLSALRDNYRVVCKKSPQATVRAYFEENRDPVEDTLPLHLRTPTSTYVPRQIPREKFNLVSSEPPSCGSAGTDDPAPVSARSAAKSHQSSAGSHKSGKSQPLAAAEEYMLNVTASPSTTTKGASTVTWGQGHASPGVEAVGTPSEADSHQKDLLGVGTTASGRSLRASVRARSRGSMAVNVSESARGGKEMSVADVDLRPLQQKINASREKMEGMVAQDTEVRLTKMLAEQREQERKVELIKQHRARLEKVAEEREEEKQRKQFLNELRAERLAQQKKFIQEERDRELREKELREAQMQKRKAEMNASMKARRKDRADSKAKKLADKRYRLKEMEEQTILDNIAAIEVKGRLLDEVQQRKHDLQQQMREEGQARQAVAMERKADRSRAMRELEDLRLVQMNAKFDDVNARLDQFKETKELEGQQKRRDEQYAKEIRNEQVQAERQRHAEYIERKKQEKITKETKYRQHMAHLAKERDERHLQKTLVNHDKETRRKQGHTADVYKSLLLQNRLEDQDRRTRKRALEIEIVRERTRKEREDVQIAKEERLRVLTELEIKARQHIFFKTAKQSITL